MKFDNAAAAGEPGRPARFRQLPAAELLGVRLFPDGDNVDRRVRRHLLQDWVWARIPSPVPARRARKFIFWQKSLFLMGE